MSGTAEAGRLGFYSVQLSAHPFSQALLVGDGFSCRLLGGTRPLGSELPEEFEVGQSQRNLQRVPERHLHYNWL